MAEDRVRQLVAFQLDRIEARNHRMDVLREQQYQEQQYFMMYQASQEDLRKYDENQNYGSVTPSTIRSPLGGGGSQYLSPDASRENLLSPGGVSSYEELHGSLPNMGYKEPPPDSYEMMHSSMPGGLQQPPVEQAPTVEPEEPEEVLEVPREGTPEDIPSKSDESKDRTPTPTLGVFRRSRPVRRSKSFTDNNQDMSDSSPGVFQRNHGIRRSKSFNDKTSNERSTVKDAPPGDFQRNCGIRRSRSFNDRISDAGIRHTKIEPPGGVFQRNHGVRRSRSFNDRTSNTKDIAQIPEAIFHRNHGIRRSRSFNDATNGRKKMDAAMPDHQGAKGVTRHHSFYNSTPAPSGRVSGTMSPLPQELRGEMLSPPPVDYRPFSPSSMSVPLSSWSSLSSVSGVWNSR